MIEIRSGSELKKGVTYEVIQAETLERAQAEFDRRYPKYAGVQPQLRWRNRYYFAPPAGEKWVRQ